jgi:hypothetical protein
MGVVRQYGDSIPLNSIRHEVVEAGARAREFDEKVRIAVRSSFALLGGVGCSLALLLPEGWTVLGFAVAGICSLPFVLNSIRISVSDLREDLLELV